MIFLNFRSTWTKRTKGYEKFFSMIYIFFIINYLYSIGEPAQALPGFKGEIVSFQKKKIIKNQYKILYFVF